LVEFSALEKTLGITFRDPQLLQQSMVHRSYLNENPEFTLPSNERLEFLGDAVLSFVMAAKLYSELPHLAEGDLTKLRAALVRRETLASLAQSLNLGDYLYLGQGEERGASSPEQSGQCPGSGVGSCLR
jgi:ribonuclease-3